MFSKIEFKILSLFYKIFSSLFKVLLGLRGVEFGVHCEFIGRPIIFRHVLSNISFGERIVLVSKSSHTALGVSRPVIIRTLAKNAEISIGNDTGLSGVTICSAISISIGERCLIGADVLIIDTDFHNIETINRRYLPIPIPKLEDSIIIGDDVFIGARSIILKGVTIGSGSVIGAGSVVTSNIPANVIAAGNPARIIREVRYEPN